jgi:hypothetical protein
MLCKNVVQTYLGAHFVKNLKIHVYCTVSHFFLEQIISFFWKIFAQHFSPVL